MSQQAVHQQLSANSYRLEHARISAACAHGVHQIAFGKDHGIAGNNVSGGNGQGNLELLKSFATQYFAQKD